jgi:hypothetical protein
MVPGEEEEGLPAPVPYHLILHQRAGIARVASTCR